MNAGTMLGPAPETDPAVSGPHPIGFARLRCARWWPCQVTRHSAIGDLEARKAVHHIYPVKPGPSGAPTVFRRAMSVHSRGADFSVHDEKRPLVVIGKRS
jgi:hypothetical protein